MVFFYSDTELKTGKPVPAHKLNPVTQYLKHSENWFFLKLVLMRGTTIDKFQARKELTICDRKLAYWDRMIAGPIMKRELEDGLLTMKRTWQMDQGPKG